MKKAFQRRCMACNTARNKYELVRIVKSPDGKILLDKQGKIDGRGAYICKNINCLEKIIKSNRIGKILNSNIDKKIYEDIRGVIIDNEIEKQNNKQ